ncbi:cytochrome c oxidase assembly protein [Solirhodobacter olei]|uniref:cytochrome c oxidase assembly protein n=1 Tax=Solirhodobacter olei TaxID=2493082 RepID=UPI000FD8721B|nr:cytochrome c oxidase assembly protein [Solirhodobacter olei]
MKPARVLFLLPAAFAAPAQAAPLLGPELLRHWVPDPVTIGLVWGLAWIYLRGTARAYQRRHPPKDWRVIAFLVGLFLVLLAMVSPSTALASQSAFAHQVQAAALRVIGPLLILVARPQRMLYAGMPKELRRGIFARLWRDPFLGHLAGRVATPVVAAALNVAVFWFWLLPPCQDASVSLPVIGYLERLSQLGAGLLFFWVLFDRRDPDLGGTSYGPRIVMLIVSALVLVVTGVALTMKPIAIWHAYPAGPRLLGFDAVDDEATAGFVNWAWVSIIYLLTIILVFFRWNAAEVRAYLRAMAPGPGQGNLPLIPETAEELWLLVEPKNRRVALSLAIIPAVMFVTVITLVVTIHYGT